MRADTLLSAVTSPRLSQSDAAVFFFFLLARSVNLAGTWRWSITVTSLPHQAHSRRSNESGASGLVWNFRQRSQEVRATTEIKRQRNSYQGELEQCRRWDFFFFCLVLSACQPKGHNTGNYTVLQAGTILIGQCSSWILGPQVFIVKRMRH